MPTRKQFLGFLILLALVASYYGIIRFFSNSSPQTTADTLTSPIPLLAHDVSLDTLSIVLQPFDPNTADSVTLIHVGLQPWQVHNMLRYRAKQGVYRHKEDLLRLYGMTDSLYQILEPYIVIALLPQDLRRDSLRRAWYMRDSLWHDSLRVDSLRRDSLKRIFHPKKDTLLELNSADTFELQYIKGIGRYAAMRIVAYRKALGGYASVEQLKEIQELAYVQWDSVFSHVCVCQDSIHPLLVNCAGIERLQHHPYLRFAEAKAIYTLRRRQFRLRAMSDLQDILSPNQQARLQPYLDFSPCQYGK